MRKDYEMTEADLTKIMDASKPVPMIALQCGTPRSPQENANAAWKELGESMGFDHMTVSPTGKGDRFFSAEEVEKVAEEISKEDAKHEDTEQKAVYVVTGIQGLSFSIGSDGVWINTTGGGVHTCINLSVYADQQKGVINIGLKNWCEEVTAHYGK